jgi:hypothetical protein
VNACGACGLDFTSVTAFDAHRVGRHAYTFKQGLAMEPSREDGRRCLGPGDPEFDERFAPGRAGRWSLVKDLGKPRPAFWSDGAASETP